MVSGTEEKWRERVEVPGGSEGGDTGTEKYDFFIWIEEPPRSDTCW
jgi:hypothetical protein